jgi:hypothetical protein
MNAVAMNIFPAAVQRDTKIDRQEKMTARTGGTTREQRLDYLRQNRHCAAL